MLIRDLEPSDETAVLALFDACEDWFTAATGQPAAPADVQSLYYALPDGADFDDKLLLVVVEGETRDARVIGAIDVVRRYPTADAWTVGLFLLHPDVLRRGLGREIAERLVAKAASQGITTIAANVTDGWEPGRRLLESLGFTFADPTATRGNRNLGPSERPVLPARLTIR